jgi:hypothetical protein
VSLPGPYIWTNRLAIDGTIQVTGLGVNTNPTNITYTVSGSTLTLQWPTDHTGWTLQSQTNNLATGLSTNSSAWHDVSGSQTTNQMIINVNPANPTVFYRLRY